MSPQKRYDFVDWFMVQIWLSIRGIGDKPSQKMIILRVCFQSQLEEITVSPVPAFYIHSMAWYAHFVSAFTVVLISVYPSSCKHHVNTGEMFIWKYAIQGVCVCVCVCTCMYYLDRLSAFYVLVVGDAAFETFNWRNLWKLPGEFSSAHVLDPRFIRGLWVLNDMVYMLIPFPTRKTYPLSFHVVSFWVYGVRHFIHP